MGTLILIGAVAALIGAGLGARRALSDRPALFWAGLAVSLATIAICPLLPRGGALPGIGAALMRMLMSAIALGQALGAAIAWGWRRRRAGAGAVGRDPGRIPLNWDLWLILAIAGGALFLAYGS